MAVVPFSVTKSGVPAVQRGIQRALLWVGLPIVVLAAWAFQGGVQDPKLDTTDTQLVLKSLMLGQFVDDYTITCVDVFAMPQVRDHRSFAPISGRVRVFLCSPLLSFTLLYLLYL